MQYVSLAQNLHKTINGRVPIHVICKRQNATAFAKQWGQSHPIPEESIRNRILTEDEKRKTNKLKEWSISKVRRIMKPFCSIGGLGIVSFYPPVETGGSCRIPSPPPYPTESCHLCRLALMRFAVMTGVMQDLLNLFKRLRRSFEGFIFFVAFPWVSCESGAANA